LIVWGSFKHRYLDAIDIPGAGLKRAKKRVEKIPGMWNYACRYAFKARECKIINDL